MKRIPGVLTVVVLGIIFLILAGTTSSNAQQVYVVVATPYYWATPSHHEWRATVTFTGGYPTSWIVCLNWENNYGGTWHDWYVGTSRVSPDGLINGYYQVRIKIKYNTGVTIYSN